MAYLPSRISDSASTFSVNATGTGQIINNVVTYDIIEWTTAVWDTESEFDLGNNRFQPSVAGYYQLNASMSFQSGGSNDNGRIAFFKNGVIDINGDQFINNPGHFHASTQMYLNGTTDFVDVRVWRNSVSGIFVDDDITQTWFDGSFILGE